MYRRVIKPVLFSLTIEQAHHAVLLLLRIIGLIPGGRWLLRKCYAVEHPALEREVFGIRFANPIGLAAGFDHNGEAFRELAALGFGFVEVAIVRFPAVFLRPVRRRATRGRGSSASRRTMPSSTASVWRTADWKPPFATCGARTTA